jgi:Frag1/DRAM/Sfk1 family
VANWHLRKGDGSWFTQWFVVEDGVISFSLRNMTLVFAFLISATLIAMCYLSCQAGTFECTLHQWPMVSDVICQEMYNRIFILLTAVMMFGVQQVNLRAFYKKLYGVIPDSRNNLMFYLGMAYTTALPLIGIFDENMWSTLHGYSAGVVFVSFMIYASMLAHSLNANKDKYPAEEQSSITRLSNSVTTLVLLTAAFGLGHFLYGSGGITAIFEWATVLYFVNFFTIASFDNPFYDSVHEPGKLVRTKRI